MADVRITVEDLVSGEREVQDLPADDYVVICGAQRHVAHTNVYPASGTHVVTIKRDPAGQHESPASSSPLRPRGAGQEGGDG